MVQLPYLVIVKLHIASSCAYHGGPSSVQHSLYDIPQRLTLLLSDDTQGVHKLIKCNPALTLDLKHSKTYSYGSLWTAWLLLEVLHVKLGLPGCSGYMTVSIRGQLCKQPSIDDMMHLALIDKSLIYLSLYLLSNVRMRATHLDLGKNNVNIDGTKALAKQLCIPAEFAELGTIQILHWHPHSKACKRNKDLPEGACKCSSVCSGDTCIRGHSMLITSYIGHTSAHLCEVWQTLLSTAAAGRVD